MRALLKSKFEIFVRENLQVTGSQQQAAWRYTEAPYYVDFARYFFYTPTDW